MTRPINIRWNDRLDELLSIIKPHVPERPVGMSGPRAPGPTHAVTFALNRWAQHIDAGQPLDPARFDQYLRSYAEMVFRGKTVKGRRQVKNIYFTDEMEAQIAAINAVIAQTVPALAGNKTATVILALEKAADELQVGAS